MKNKYLITGPVLALFSVLILSLIALFVVREADKSRKLPVIKQVEDFEFTESNGQSFTKEDILGKINVLDFFFTSCRGPCPMMSEVMSQLYDYYQSTEKVQFISVSVDPERDSLSVLQDYAKKYGVTDNRWKFLRGDLEKVQWLSESVFMLGGELPDLHSTKFILIDHQGNIRGYYDPFDPKNIKLLKTHIRELGKSLR